MLDELFKTGPVAMLVLLVVALLLPGGSLVAGAGLLRRWRSRRNGAQRRPVPRGRVTPQPIPPQHIEVLEHQQERDIRQAQELDHELERLKQEQTQQHHHKGPASAADLDLLGIGEPGRGARDLERSR